MYAKDISRLPDFGSPKVTEASDYKLISEQNATNAPKLDIGFRILKIDASNMKNVYYAPDTVKKSDLVAHADNIKDDRI